ncbi:MAG TPA: cupredoxin family copper-binding protein [Dongiaceae bacterium]|nr:cupredoxin family copper-binding protein [Dongiaceae bacterium]
MHESRKKLAPRATFWLAAIAGPLLISGPAQAEPPDRPGTEGPVSTTEPTAAPPSASASASQQTALPVRHVDIDNFDFSPMQLTVAVGTEVTWTNHDDIPHTVVSSDNPPAFKSPPLDTDDAFSVTFAKPGTYTYFCSVHPKMVGTVVVQAK